MTAPIANLFWNRVEEQAQRLSLSPSRVLAHTLAHKLGHLLLGSNSHAPTGIMIARWNASSVTRICQDGLYFDAQQSETIRAEVGRRRAQAGPVQQAMLAPQE